MIEKIQYLKFCISDDGKGNSSKNNYKNGSNSNRKDKRNKKQLLKPFKLIGLKNNELRKKLVNRLLY